MVYGNFRGADGHHYYVEFYGAGVSDQAVDIVGVTLSMATHDRKFVGYKSTTCRVEVLTDHPLVDLYARGVRDISVKITDETESEVVFAGYVVPFVFEQGYTGTADVLAIDCVDAVTAAKDMLYRSADDDDKYGIDVPAWSVVMEMRSHAGGYDKIREVWLHSNFDWENAEGTTMDAIIAQAGFLQDEMTALDALTAVCMFFGYTCAMVGDKLCFYDEHCLINAEVKYRRNATVVRWDRDANGKLVETRRKYYNTSEGPLKYVELSEDSVHNDVTVSIERAYDAIQITPSGSDTSVILSDVCAPENVRKNTDGRGTQPILTGDTTSREYRRPVMSKVMELGEWKAGELVDWTSLDQMKIKVDGAYQWNRGAMLMDVTRNTIEPQPNGSIICTGREDKTVMVVREFGPTDSAFRGGYSLRGYSHTGGYVALRIKCYVNDDEWNTIVPPSELPDYGATEIIQIKAGDKYYSYYSPGLSLRDSASSSLIFDKGELRPTPTSANVWENRFILPVPAGVQLRVEIGWDNVSSMVTNSSSMIVEHLELVGYGETIYTGGRAFRHEYVADPEEVLSVDTVLTTRNSWREEDPLGSGYVLGINARPSIVASRYYPCGGYMGRAESETIDATGVLMEQLKARYGERRIRYAMTVDGRILPTDTIAYDGGRYTVEGYERDLVNDTTRITIN